MPFHRTALRIFSSADNSPCLYLWRDGGARGTLIAINHRNFLESLLQNVALDHSNPDLTREGAMLEALWTVHFVADTGLYGAGVAVLETGRILGGDGYFAYVGEFTYQTGQPLEATIRVTNHSGSGYSVVFGNREPFTLKLSGEPNRDGFDLTGYATEAPEKEITIRLSRFAELPDPG